MAPKEKATPSAGARSKASASGRERAGATTGSTAKPAAASSAPGKTASLRFHAGWREELQGDIVPGGKLRVDYAPERLPDYRGMHKNKPTWDIVAMILFSPGGQLYSGSVARKPLELEVPRDASEVTLWFQNTDGSGGAAWDSRYGENYRFGVSSGAASSSRAAGGTRARAKSTPAAAGSAGGAGASRARGASTPASGRAAGSTGARAGGTRATGGTTNGAAPRGSTSRRRGS